MFLLKAFTIVAALSSVFCQDETRSLGINLQFKEIRQVMSTHDSSGKQHNIKVVIESHPALMNIVEWNLSLLKNGREPISYTVKGDGAIATSQTELIFDGNLVPSDSMYLYARNESKTVANAYTVADIQDMNSDVTWVGNHETESSASLRVQAGELEKEITVGRDVCEFGDNPCYYINPKPKPSTSERCYNPTPQLKQCDDRVTSFKASSSLPEVFLGDEGTLEVEIVYKKKKIDLEVVAYNPSNPGQLYSMHPFRCQFPTGASWKEGDKIRCRQDLNLPDGTTEMEVLVVRLDAQGDVAESSLIFYDDNADITPEKTNTGVIMGAVFGTIIGIALILLVIVYCMKKKDKKNAKTTRGSSAVYSTTTTTDPVEA